MQAFVYFYDIAKARWHAVDIDGQVPDFHRDQLLVEKGQSSDDEIADLAVHTLTAAHLILQFWESVLGRPIHWRWNRNRIGIPLRLRIDDHTEGAVFFFHEARIYFGRIGMNNISKAFDVIGHEVTHAVLRSVCPKLARSSKKEDLAWVEALCDLTPLFTILATNQIRINLDLNSYDSFPKDEPNILSEFAEGFGKANLGIRSALSIKDARSISELRDQIVYKIYHQLIGSKRHWEKPTKLFERVFKKFE